MKNEVLGTAIEQFAKMNAEALRKEWGRDGKSILSAIAKYAEINEQANAERFEDFWSAYPTSKRKVDKQGCMRLWQRNQLDSIADQILAALTVMKQDDEWIRYSGAFIPAPMVWLRQQRWTAIETGRGNDIFAGAI